MKQTQHLRHLTKDVDSPSMRSSNRNVVNQILRACRHLATVLPVATLMLATPSSPAAEADAAARTFTNPILSGFHADPSMCRVGDDYYMVHSTFEYFPGVPVYHSRDLVNWRLIGHCLTRKSQLNLDRIRSSQGIFAPTIRHHNGTFYMITTHVGGAGNFYVTATNPAGPWTDPVWLDRSGIDPSLFFDEDGKVYYTRQVDGERGYSGQQELNLQTGKLEGPLRQLWRGTGGVWPEGPHLYKVDGKYYLMISEGGTSYDHSITIARSDSPWGPYEPNPNNPILSHRNRPNHPFQALGHGDMVPTPDGWWMVFLGFRPQGGQHHHIGRESFLAPVHWENGWPIVNSNQPISATMRAPRLTPHPWPQLPPRDDFDTDRLRLDWRHVRNPVESNYSLSERAGWLRLRGSAVTLTNMASPTFIGQPQTAFNCRVATRLEFNPAHENEEAGLVLRGNERNHFAVGLQRTGEKRQVFLRAVRDGKVEIKAADIPQGPITLSVRAEPLKYEFLYQVEGGTETSLGTAATKDLSTETLTAQSGAPFNFTGVFLGLFATGNGSASSTPADFDWFEYQPQDNRQP